MKETTPEVDPFGGGGIAEESVEYQRKHVLKCPSMR